MLLKKEKKKIISILFPDITLSILFQNTPEENVTASMLNNAAVGAASFIQSSLTQNSF